MRAIRGHLPTVAVLVLMTALLPTDTRAQVVGSNVLFPECFFLENERSSADASLDIPSLENEPSLAVQGQSVLAAWRGQCNSIIRARASNDGGTTWQDATAIPFSGKAYTPLAICAGDSGRFYLVAPIIDIAGGQGNSIEAHEGHFVVGTFVWRKLTNPVPLPYDGKGEPASIAMQFDPESRNLYVVFTKVIGPESMPEYRTTFVRSTDLGSTWEPQQELTGRESAGARLVIGTGGELSVVWENYVLRKIMDRRSNDFGASFEPEAELVPILDSVAVPSSWASEYNRSNPGLPGFGIFAAPAAFSIAVDRSNSPRRGTWYLATTEYATGTAGPRTGVVAEIENNDYVGSATPIEIGNDATGNVTGSEYVFDGDYFTFVGEAGQSIWMSGRFFSSSGVQQNIFGLRCGNDPTALTGLCGIPTIRDGTAPPVVYTLPTTGRYYIGVGATLFASIGYVFSLRSFTVDPGSLSRDHRDILLCSSTDRGVTWSPKVRVSDGPESSEETFPEVVVDDEGRVHVAWYDRRDSDGCRGEVNTYWTWSSDGGATFATGVRVSDENSQVRGGWEVGDHLALATENGKVYVAWTRDTGPYADVWSAVITDIPTPVLVSGLRAEESSGRPELRWSVGDVSEVAEFRIHRATGANEYELTGTVTPSLDREYHWRDETARAGTRYRYRLEVVRRAGGSIWEGPVEALIALPALRLAWRGASPNPFDDVVALELETPNRAGTIVKVYDVTGHEVAVLTSETNGEHAVVRWNGRDRNGRLVAPGVYLVRAQLGTGTVVRQVVRMK